MRANRFAYLNEMTLHRVIVERTIERWHLINIPLN